MWSYRNKYCHCCENGKAIFATVKDNKTMKLLYGMRDLVFPDYTDTYFDVDIDTILNNSLHSKQAGLQCGKILFIPVSKELNRMHH